MPQLKKLSVLPSSILPKIDLGLESVLSSYQGSQQDFSTYLQLYSDMKASPVLTSEAESDEADSIPAKPRKRQRLDHLSQEEKIMRRKMKNRVAAQTARDRKKARMAELEDQVVELETERKMLLLANIELQNKNAALENENAELKLRLGQNISEVKVKEEPSSITDAKVVVESKLSDNSRSLEHASFINVPLQKEQDLRILTLWMMQFVYLPVIARLMLFLTYFSSAVLISYNVKTLIALHQSVEKVERVNCQPLKWWGPHQKAWNPTKN